MNIEEVYDLYVDKVYKFFYVQCFDKPTAEDLTSRTFLGYLDATTKQEINNPKTYLYGTMRNLWFQYIRDKYAHKTDSLSNPELMEQYVDYVTETLMAEPAADRDGKL